MFSGIFPALITPFSRDGAVNTRAIEKLVGHLVGQGVKGFYVCGSTGEAFLMSERERETVLSSAMCAGQGTTMIAQVGSASTEEAVRLAQDARRLGYDAVSAVPPFYYTYSFEEIKSHYQAIAAVGLPLIVYNIPKYSGVDFSQEQLNDLLAIDGVMGLKHTSSDYFALERIKSAFPGKTVYNGYDEMCLAGLVMGADGAIGSTYNLMADKFIALYDAVCAQDLATAKKLQEEANEIIVPLVKLGVMRSIKALYSMQGLDCGTCRAPFRPLSREESSTLAMTVLPKLAPYRD